MIVHLKMLWKSIELVALGFLILIMIISMVFANSALAQWRVDENMNYSEVQGREHDDA